MAIEGSYSGDFKFQPYPDTRTLQMQIPVTPALGRWMKLLSGKMGGMIPNAPFGYQGIGLIPFRGDGVRGNNP